MCRPNNTIDIFLPIAAHLSHTGEKYYKDCAIDICIVDIVDALNKGGLETQASYCGHGEEGSIILMDGRELRILEAVDELP